MKAKMLPFVLLVLFLLLILSACAGIEYHGFVEEAASCDVLHEGLYALGDENDKVMEHYYDLIEETDYANISCGESQLYCDENGYLADLYMKDLAPSTFRLIDGVWKHAYFSHGNAPITIEQFINQYDSYIILDEEGAWINAHFLPDGTPITMEQFLNQYDSYVIFNEFGEFLFWYSWIAFISDTPLYNFSYVTIEHEARMDYNYHYVQDALFSIDKLPPDTPVLFAWRTDSMTANRGISFVSADGQTSYYGIISNEVGGGFPPLHVISLDRLNER